jgi:hypothetical protein
MSAILEQSHRRVRRAGVASAAIVVVVLGVAAAARLARAQPRFQEFSGPGLTVSIISPANAAGSSDREPAVILGPGTQPAFALEVTLSPLSRNESGNVAYAAMTPEPLVRRAGAPLWIAFAILGLATAVFTEGKRWRAWLIAGLLVLFAIGAPGCGSDSGSGGHSSTQTVTTVAAEAEVVFQVERETGVAQSVTPLPAIVAGLPLKIGTITGQ